MTMIFTHQSSAIHPFEQSAYVRGGAFSDAVAAQKKSPAPLQYRAPVDLAERRSSKSALQETSIIMPCPKKVSVLCPNALLGGSPLTSPVMTSPLRPIFPIIIEDSQEEIHHPIDFVESDEDSFFEQAACAELMEIMSNGSSRSSSKSSSPQPSFQDSLPTEATIPFSLEEHAFLGTSPIVRSNNPLPNDESFSPDTSEAAAPVIPQLFQSFLARHRHQAKVFDFNLNVDEAGETQAPYRSKLTRVF